LTIGQSKTLLGQLVNLADTVAPQLFGPQMLQGQEKNWVKTVAGKGWFPIFRFYGPLEPLYDKSWVLNDIEKVN
jgi:hypothetical protein